MSRATFSNISNILRELSRPPKVYRMGNRIVGPACGRLEDKVRPRVKLSVENSATLHLRKKLKSKLSKKRMDIWLRHQGVWQRTGQSPGTRP